MESFNTIIRKLGSDIISREEMLRSVSDSMRNFDQHFACRSKVKLLSTKISKFVFVLISLFLRYVIVS